MNTRPCSLIIIVLVGLSNATVWAQSMVERFDRIDRNRDGEVTREETARAPWCDKAGPPTLGAKLWHFVGKGYIYASINYRLSPEMPNQDGIQHPIHAQDCAKAVAWVHNHIAEYGGDPGQIHLMGHSAGGHLAGIVGTNDRFLKAEGEDLSILKSNVLLDPAAIDIPRYVELTEGRKMTALYELAFGKDEANWADASPQHHVASGKHIPPTLIFYAGERMNLDQLAPALARTLNEAGSPSQAVDTVSLDHGQINSHIGMTDEPMTDLIMRLHAGEDASRFPAVLPKHSEVADVENKVDTAGD